MLGIDLMDVYRVLWETGPVLISDKEGGLCQHSYLRHQGLGSILGNVAFSKEKREDVYTAGMERLLKCQGRRVCLNQRESSAEESEAESAATEL